MDVFFETQSGSTLSIEVSYWDTVLDIKKKIEKYERIPVSKQTLLFQGNVLEDDLDIVQCKIFHKSRLQVFDSSFRNPNHNSDQVLPAEKFPPSTEQIINDQDSPVTAQLLQTADKSPPSNSTKEITDIQDSPVKDIKVESDNKNDQTEQSPTVNTQDLPWRPGPIPTRMTVNVLQHSGAMKIPVDVNPRDNVEELRKELVKIEQSGLLNLPQEGYFFIHFYSKLIEDRTFWFNGVDTGDTIEIIPGDGDKYQWNAVNYQSSSGYKRR